VGHGGKHARLIPQAAAQGDWREVRRLVQGGSSGLADFTRYASTLVASARSDVPSPSPPVDPKDDLIASYELALRTLRDETLPAARAAVDEAERLVAESERIVTQFVGGRPS
jgi:hypothetical protein